MQKKFNKVSALVLTSIFAVMQVSASTIDTGLGNGNGGAVINSTSGGFAGVETGLNSATLKFNGNSHVNWNSLNVNKGETLNFNTVDNAKGITVLNTVNSGMSNIYGQINADSGISKLIISNPNGVLFDGAKFTTAGDAMITAQGAAMNAQGVVTYDPSATRAFTPNGQDYVITVKNSDFTTGGDLNFVAPTMNVIKSAFKANDGAGTVRFTTTNGQDYFITDQDSCDGVCSDKNYTETTALRLETIQVDGDVYVTSNKGMVKSVKGGTIKGNLDVQSDGSVSLNYTNNGNQLQVTKDVNVKGNGVAMYARNASVGGNLNMHNGGGFLEVKDVNVGGNMNLKTTLESKNPYGYKHFVHVIGNSNVNGDVTINAENNIHIGNYDYDDRRLLDGNLSVGGNLTAHAKNGHVMTTINVQADKIDYTSDNFNVLTDDKTLLTAKEYKFKSNGYIGGVTGKTEDCTTTADEVISIMENYTYIPQVLKNHAYTQIAGGKITNIETPRDAQTYIASHGDVTMTGANAGDINITAYRKRIDIQGSDVHAKNINVGPETDYLKLEFKNRDFTTNYTNIRDERVVTIKPDEEITYELADGGYNQPTLKPGEKTTYLEGPAKPAEPEPQPEPEPEPEPQPQPDPEPEPQPDPEPEPEPQPEPEPEPQPEPEPEPEPQPEPEPEPEPQPEPEPEPQPEPEPEPEPQPEPEPEPEPQPEPEPEPEPEPQPEPEPEPQPEPEPEPEPDPEPQPQPKVKKPSNDDNVKVVRNWVPEDLLKAPTSTPVAFAADLDEDEEAAGVRKNVDGSVTVVRAYPIFNIR